MENSGLKKVVFPVTMAVKSILLQFVSPQTVLLLDYITVPKPKVHYKKHHSTPKPNKSVSLNLDVSACSVNLPEREEPDFESQLNESGYQTLSASQQEKFVDCSENSRTDDCG